jgi:hypothetical protein
MRLERRRGRQDTFIKCKCRAGKRDGVRRLDAYVRENLGNLSHAPVPIVLLPDLLTSSGASNIGITTTVSSISSASSRRESARYHQAMSKVRTCNRK